MSRNEEKALSVLNRWTMFKQELRLGGAGAGPGRRPRAPRWCKTVPEATGHRRAVVKEISDKVDEIQDASLGEHRIRELNDEINALLKEKWAWERRIEALGGPNLSERGGGRGPRNTYKYFGAAKDLPQVRELLNKPAPKRPTKRSKLDILKHIDHTYFESITDISHDPHGLLEAEARYEHSLRAAAIDEARKKDAESNVDEHQGDDEEEARPLSDFDQLLVKTVTYAELAFLTPEQKEELDTSKAMEKLVVDRKRRELMAKYLL